MPHDLPASELPSGDLPARRILAVAVGVLIMVGIVIGVVAAFFKWQVPTQAVPAPRAVKGQDILEDQARELKTWEAAERQRLHAYRWIDRDKKILSIPIDRAMAIIAAKGEAAYGPIAQDGAAAPPSSPAAEPPQKPGERP